MANIITAGNSTNGGTQITTDTSGTLNIVTGSGSGATAIAVDTSQNVGIGTTSPSAKLDLYNGGSQLKINMVASGNGFAITNDPSYTLLQTANAVYMAFGTNGAERMRLDSNGSLLVGGTSIPAAGSGAKTYFTIANGYAQAIQRTGSDGPQVAYINAAGNLAGRIDVSGTTCSLFSVSDYRLKENVQPVVGALDKVAQLKPCTYIWKESGNEEQGFIAHELKEVIPSCVSGDKDAVDASGNIIPQAVSMNASIISTLTAAIQELKAELDAVKAKVGA